MRLLMVIAFLIFAMPMTGFGWAEGSNVLLDPNLICKKTRRIRGKFAEICRHDSILLKEIINGINLGFRECEYQFKNRRWNCTILRKSMRKILMRDTRESSFVNAITSAGITYGVTRACSMGTLIECSCDKTNLKRIAYSSTSSSSSSSSLSSPQLSSSHVRRNSIDEFSLPINQNTKKPSTQQNRRRNSIQKEKRAKLNQIQRERKLLKTLTLPNGEWEWGGCGDNVQFGFRKSKDFLDARYRRRSDIRTLVKLHNNQAGRLTVRDHMTLQCKCHGLSGSCTMKTCWLKMPSFREISKRLKEKFDGGSKVVAGNDGNSFIPEGITIKSPTKYDLVYTDDSPDFCRPNHKTGSLGTIGRECNVTSEGVDGCDLLCCNRGYDTKLINEKVNCKCVFKWCCEVKCSTCIGDREISTCR